MDAFAYAQLTDALARGRLAPAEIAAIPPRELEALFETAARCLDASRDTEAAHLLGGLVTLFPYSARYWRAYAIALHRRLEIERARAAYEASLALEPDHELTRCYHCEVLIYLGHADEAAARLRELVDARDRATAERAAELLRQLDALSTWQPPPPEPEEPTHPAADRPRFVLDEKRDLPLEPSRFEDEELESTLVREEVTKTARIFAPISDEPTAPLEMPREATDTALVGRRGERPVTATALVPGRKGRAPPEPTAEHREGSATALLPGRKGRPAAPASPEGSATALLPGRKGRPAEEPVHTDPPAGEEPTHTDLLETKEQTHTDLLETEEQTHTDLLETEEQTHTDLLEEALDDIFEPTHTAVVLRRDGALTFDRDED